MPGVYYVEAAVREDDLSPPPPEPFQLFFKFFKRDDFAHLVPCGPFLLERWNIGKVLLKISYLDGPCKRERIDRGACLFKHLRALLYSGPCGVYIVDERHRRAFHLAGPV